MKDNFVTYEIAVQLKELGFNEPCLGLWRLINSEPEFNITSDQRFSVSQEKVSYIHGDSAILAPLWQQVKKWFLTKHGVHTTIDWEFHDGFHYYFKYTFPNGNYGNSEEYYDTMDEAEIRLIEKIVGMLVVKNKTK